MKQSRQIFHQRQTGGFFSSSALSALSCSILLLLLSCWSTFAHELRPAYLELKEIKAETYDVLWKAPGMGDNMRLGLYVEFPADCKNLTEPRGTMINNALAERWTVQRPGGLTGGTVHIAGLSATMTDVLVRLERLDGSTQITRLTPAAPGFVVEVAPNTFAVARTYTVLGIEHILSGADHLLFVLALILITRGGWKLAKRSPHSPFRTVLPSLPRRSVGCMFPRRRWKPASRSALYSSPQRFSASGVVSKESPPVLPGWSHSASDSCTVSALPAA